MHKINSMFDTSISRLVDSLSITLVCAAEECREVNFVIMTFDAKRLRALSHAPLDEK